MWETMVLPFFVFWSGATSAQMLCRGGFRSKSEKYYVEQMVLEMFDMLSSMVDTNCRQYDDFEKAWKGELSKEARKELYLKYQDKGYEH